MQLERQIFGGDKVCGSRAGCGLRLDDENVLVGPQEDMGSSLKYG